VPPIRDVRRQPDELMGAWFTNQSPISVCRPYAKSGVSRTKLMGALVYISITHKLRFAPRDGPEKSQTTCILTINMLI
jgi:hypothetical protein